MVWAILNAAQAAALKELVEAQHSDRAFAILAGVLLDDSLRIALELRLRPKSGNSDINEKLFKVGAPLGNLAPKIDLAYQLYMLDKPARNTMYGLSEIRNFFAHRLEMSFVTSNKKLEESWSKLSLHKDVTHYPSRLWTQDGSEEIKIVEIEPIQSRRDLFVVNLKLALHYLMADWDKHEPWNNTPRVFKNVVGSDFDAPPTSP